MAEPNFISHYLVKEKTVDHLLHKDLVFVIFLKRSKVMAEIKPS